MQGLAVQPDKQGYLFLKRVVKASKGWKCSWFVLEKGILMYYKNIKVGGWGSEDALAGLTGRPNLG